MRQKINIIEYFEETVKSFPDRIAVSEVDKEISFEELMRKSQTLATVITDKTNGKIKSPILVLIEKSIESVTADLAILYSGNAFMNVDTMLPISRIETLIDSINPILIISTSKYINKTGFHSDILYVMDDEYSGVEVTINSFGYENLIDTDLFCLVTTSGSTGTPKCTALTHLGIIDYIEGASKEFDFNSYEIMASVGPNSFDLATGEMCLSIAFGFTLLVCPRSYSVLPLKLLQFMEERRATMAFWVSSLFVTIANMEVLPLVKLENLHLVMFAGEVLPTNYYNYWKHMYPNAKFYNIYGPAETTIQCTNYEVTREFLDEEIIPIGHPWPNATIEILDDDKKPVRGGEIGEIYVTGPGIASGYYNNPEATAKAFVQNPTNTKYLEQAYRTGDMAYVNDYGEIVFKGRRDYQIKINGKRFEITEIESIAIDKLKIVKNCCAVFNDKVKEITLFYEADREIPRTDFINALKVEIPQYMIPTHFIYLDKLPQNPNGKIDRKLLMLRCMDRGLRMKE